MAVPLPADAEVNLQPPDAADELTQEFAVRFMRGTMDQMANKSTSAS